MLNNQVFENVDFTKQLLKGFEFEECIFRNCNFSSVNLSNMIFIDCEFFCCDLGLAKIDNSLFNDVKFKESKLIGLHFNLCNPFTFSVGFYNCNLGDSSFYSMKLKYCKFKDSKMHNVEFTDADLSEVVFENCDLFAAVFENTQLERTDFYSSVNYSFDAEKNKLKKTRFSRTGVLGLLAKYDIKIE